MSETLSGVDSRLIYTALIAAIALYRLWELAVSRRHQRALEQRGAVEVGAEHYPWMVALHTAFLFSCVAEVWMLDRPWEPSLAIVAASVLAVALTLRWWTLRTLGDRWTTRVLVLPGEDLVSSGPYRWFRHPNYVVVVMEIAAVPLIHGAWWTAVVFTTANLVLLRERIRVEKGALDRLAGGAA